MSGASIDPDAFNAFEAAGWETAAVGYDDFFARITPRVVEPLLDAAQIGAGTRVLDVATGPGYAAAGAARRGAVVTGIDVADAMVSRARRLHPQVRFRRADAEDLPFADASFDAVLANFALMHLGRPERAAAQSARVLVEGGRLAATVWDVPERARFVGVLLDAVAEAGGRAPADIPAGPPFFRFSDELELARLLREQRLADIELTTLAFTLRVATPAALWHGLLDGTVRTSALVRRQPEAVQRRIRSAFDRIVARYRDGAAVALPVSIKLASARKPPAPVA